MALPTKRAVLKAVRQLHQHPQDCECALCADKKLRTLPVTTMFTGAELKQFDRVGMFDEVEGLLAAADVHVAPPPDGSAQTIVEALAPACPAWRSTCR